MDKDKGFGHTDSGCAAFFIFLCSYFVILLLIFRRALRAFLRTFFIELLDHLNSWDIFFELIVLIASFLFVWRINVKPTERRWKMKIKIGILVTLLSQKWHFKSMLFKHHLIHTCRITCGERYCENCSLFSGLSLLISSCLLTRVNHYWSINRQETKQSENV